MSDGSLGSVKDILRTGNDIVAAGYCMYGAATELVMCFKAGKVERFVTNTGVEICTTHDQVLLCVHPRHRVIHRSTALLQALDPSLGEFVHTHSDVKIPADGGKKIYSCNEGNSPHWDDAIKQSIVYFKENKCAPPFRADGRLHGNGSGEPPDS